jgi:ubiquinone/menaquinone biosynthesis C-methylase UbiE
MTGKRYTREDVLAKAGELFSGIDFTDEAQLANLTYAHAAGAYDWYSSACTIFGRRYHDWYGALETLLADQKGPEEAKRIVEKTKQAGKKNRVEKFSRKTVKYGAESVRAEFGKLTEGMDFSDEAQLAKLSFTRAREGYGWFSSACSIFGTKGGDWYGALERLLAETKGESEARRIAEKIKKDYRAAHLSRATKPRYSEAEIRKFFMGVTEGLDFSDEAQLAKLAYPYARRDYGWISSAGNVFGAKGSDWYGALETLLAETKGAEEARGIVGRIRKVAMKNGIEKSSRKKRKYSAESVRAEFGKLTEGMDFSDEAQLAKLSLSSVMRDYGWFSSACSIFGANGEDWYGALERLLAERMEAGETQKILEKIRRVAKRSNLSRATKPRYSEAEIRKFFMGATEGLDFSDEAQLAKLTYTRAKDNYGWFSSAGNVFGTKGSDWYGALETLLAETKGAEEARGIVGRIREVGKKNQGGSRVILVSSQRLSDGQSIDFAPMVSIMASVQEPVLKNGGSIGNGEAQKVVLSIEGSRQATEAQKLLFGFGGSNWAAMAADYAANFSRLAPFIIHHLAVEKLLAMAKKSLISWPESVLSQASGISEFWMAFEGMRSKIEAAGFPMPRIIDLDLTHEMLRQGQNPLKVRADMRAMPFAAGCFSLVENSSIYQFRHPDVVRDALVEAARVTQEGGTLILSSANKPFSPAFHSGLRAIGYETSDKPGDSVALSDGFLSAVGQTLGESFAAKMNESVKGWHLLVAVKSRETNAAVEASDFRMERQRTRLNQDLVEIGRVSRAAFGAATVQEFDAGISAILELLAKAEGITQSEKWSVFYRVARLESTKLADLGAGYEYDRKDLDSRATEFLQRFRRRNHNAGRPSAGGPLLKKGA